MPLPANFQDLLRLAEGKPPTATEIAKIFAQTSPQIAAWVFGQWELRNRAITKFSRAREMLFVREALEQATHEAIARYHALRFPVGARVADLTAGIGADLIALAARGEAVGFDLDSERLEYAEHNLKIHGCVSELKQQDSLLAEWDFDYAFADPARRVGGKRTLDPNDFSPNPLELATKMRKLKLGGIKLSPMLPDSFLNQIGDEIEFVSFGGECREALVLVGHEAKKGRKAVHIDSGEVLDNTATAPQPAPIRNYFYEADPAAIRAHCLGALCATFDLTLVGDSNGYLSGDQPIQSVWLKGYRVIQELSGDLKKTERALRELGSGMPVIKSRGLPLDTSELRKKLKLKGDRGLVLAIYPVGKSLKHLVLEPL